MIACPDTDSTGCIIDDQIVCHLVARVETATACHPETESVSIVPDIVTLFGVGRDQIVSYDDPLGRLSGIRLNVDPIHGQLMRTVDDGWIVSIIAAVVGKGAVLDDHAVDTYD